MSRAASCLLALALSACMLSGGTRMVTAVQMRATVVGVNLDGLDAKIRGFIDRGEIWPGATEAELYVSRGEPRIWWNTRFGANACRIIVHQGRDPALAEIAVTTCGGRVVQMKPIEPPLPCWRLAEVGPRVAAAAEYFEGRPIEIQWQIVIGILKRGQAENDVVIAFGEPHNRGFDEREDGRRAEELVFLDRSKEAYGLNVTLIDDKVVGWKMPAERKLTPEAEQKHLQEKLAAMEQRLTAKLAELEALAIKNHAESVKLFGDVMAKQDQMLEKLSEPPPVVVVDGAGNVVGSGGGGGGDGGGGGAGFTPPPEVEQKPEVKLPPGKTCRCEEIPCDGSGIVKVNSCQARCIGAEPNCQCNGKCNKSGSGKSQTIFPEQHKCGCR
jgi:hypothetical protein